MRTRVLWLAVSASLLMTASPALAEQARDAARRHYAEGQALYNAGNYSAALSEFRAAYAAQPHPVVLKSQAECLERMGNIREAMELFQRYLSERPDAPDRAAIESRIASYRSRPGRLRIVTNPPGATVTLDGARVNGATPMDVNVQSGQHAVAVQLEGYQMVLQEFNMPPAGSHTVQANLVPVGGAVATTPTPGPGGQVVVQQRRWHMTTPVWVMVGVTGAALVTGTVTGALAMADQGEFDDLRDDQDTERSELEDLRDSGETKALVADISFGVAAAAAITGIVLFFVQNRRGAQTAEGEDSTPIAINPLITEEGGGVQIGGRF